jgi:hypothetical protein
MIPGATSWTASLPPPATASARNSRNPPKCLRKKTPRQMNRVGNGSSDRSGIDWRRVGRGGPEGGELCRRARRWIGRKMAVLGGGRRRGGSLVGERDLPVVEFGRFLYESRRTPWIFQVCSPRAACVPYNCTSAPWVTSKIAITKFIFRRCCLHFAARS